jgi:hypothetical protein
MQSINIYNLEMRQLPWEILNYVASGDHKTCYQNWWGSKEVSKREKGSALGTEFLMLLWKKNFKAYLGGDQESLLVKQSEGKIET